ncbi:MAG: aminotransferase class I/II-fold pyridoxal phosphate-dependent enzyme [Candidatus Woesearchaeota archaeon]
MKFVASYDPYDNKENMSSLFSAISQAIRDGYSYFDLLVPVGMIDKYLKNIAKFRALKTRYLIHADYKLDLANPKFKDQDLSYFTKLIEFAVDIQAKLVNIHPSTRFTNGLTKKQRINAAIKAIASILNIAKCYNIRIAIENLEGDRVGNSPQELQQFFNRFKQLYFTFDIIHALMNKQDYQSYYPLFKDRIRLIHISGISSTNKHYRTPIYRSEVKLNEILTFIPHLDIPIKIENISYGEFTRSVNYLKTNFTNITNEPIRLDTGDIKYVPPQSIVTALSKELSRINLYPREEYQQLKKEIAKYCGVNRENILLTNGSDEAIGLLTATFGKTVLLPEPTFWVYTQAAKRYRAEIITSNCLNQEKYEVNYTEKDLSHASLVWICNPNNPTGSIVPRNKIVEILQSTQAAVAVDECYSEISGKTIIDLIDKYKNLIIIRSMSKSFGLAGLRLGYIVSNTKVINQIEPVRPPYNVNRLAAVAGRLALEEKEYYQNILTKMKILRDKFKRFLRKNLITVFDSNTNFLLLKFKDMESAKNFYMQLERKGVFTYAYWLSKYPSLKGPYIRITIDTEQNMQLLEKYIKEILPYLN